MRLCHLADLHVCEGPRLSDHAAVLADILARCREAGIHGTIIAGDLAGRTVPHRTTPREREVLYPFLTGLADLGPVWVLYGNHDQSPDLDGFTHLGGAWPIHVLSRAGSARYHTPAGPLQLYHLAYPTKAWLMRGAATGLLSSTEAIQAELSKLFQLWEAKIGIARMTDPTLPHVFTGHAMVRGSTTSGGEVLAGLEVEISRADLERPRFDYGALGHLHHRQEPARRCWYPGSPWRNDHAEQDDKGWHLVDLAPFGDQPLLEGSPDAEPLAFGADRYEADRRLAARVLQVLTPCRRFVTLDYRWASGAPSPQEDVGWHSNPWMHSEADSAALEAAVHGAEVRMRLVVPEQHVASCPWGDEVEHVRAMGAHRIQVEKVIEPSMRVRAPEIAEATTNAERLEVFWASQASPPNATERAAALALLAELETEEDESIADRQDAMMSTPDQEARP